MIQQIVTSDGGGVIFKWPPIFFKNPTSKEAKIWGTKMLNCFVLLRIVLFWHFATKQSIWIKKQPAIPHLHSEAAIHSTTFYHTLIFEPLYYPVSLCVSFINSIFSCCAKVCSSKPALQWLGNVLIVACMLQYQLFQAGTRRHIIFLWVSFLRL